MMTAYEDCLLSLSAPDKQKKKKESKQHWLSRHGVGGLLD
jgi:hypothetical protein